MPRQKLQTKIRKPFKNASAVRTTYFSVKHVAGALVVKFQHFK